MHLLAESSTVLFLYLYEQKYIKFIIILKVTMCNNDGMGCFVMNFVALMCLEEDGRDCFPSGLYFLQLEIYAFLDFFPIQ